MRVELVPGAVVVRFGSSFSTAEVQRLAEVLSISTAIREITLDFSEVRRLEETALGSLADALRGREHSAPQVRGLNRHHRRMLQYLGLGHEGAGAADGE